MKKAYLILEDGNVFAGGAFGAIQETVGEVVFTTAMTGYIETLTDPSYYGQIVVQSFPLIGNYGINTEDFEAKKPALKAYIVKVPCETPSNFRSTQSLDAYLKSCGVAGLYGIDTRKLVKIIRNAGVLNGKIVYSPPTRNDKQQALDYSVKAPVSKVTCGETPETGAGEKRIALIDYGAKNGIEAELLRRGCTVKRFPFHTAAQDILRYNPNGIMLSNGPGNPADPANAQAVETLRALQKSFVPMFGICLGHQLLALANGYTTRKLKFGHRGANQPVKDTGSGRVYITSQNHGYEVIADNSSFINVNDGTCEGLDYGHSFSVQFHPEACGGPLDTSFLFDRFIERIESHAKK
ncbi:MAG: carbamoyl phosphate synthase small subunit [Firmicutes bacterium]|nr:carbamoyl phosphate synthase small subunit [Bacillota bacterium]